MFQSAHPHGVRQGARAAAEAERIVSIRAPTRGATFVVGIEIVLSKFQSAHPHGVRPLGRVHGGGLSGFNPRTHTGCDVRQIVCSSFWSVSIRAPTRGATVTKSFATKALSVSIRAPTRGATRAALLKVQTSLVSIRAPTRGATEYKYLDDDVHGVSIRAPTRGATYDDWYRNTFVQFQSAHPHGVRLIWIFGALPENCFNPRTHTGCDLVVLCNSKFREGFNPRTHTGCDSVGSTKCKY